MLAMGWPVAGLRVRMIAAMNPMKTSPKTPPTVMGMIGTSCRARAGVRRWSVLLFVRAFGEAKSVRHKIQRSFLVPLAAPPPPAAPGTPQLRGGEGLKMAGPEPIERRTALAQGL